MKVYYDLHIHSVLSACADVLQTPNNILNMCMLKELNLISICDHNSSKQYESIDLIKDSYDFNVFYGMEITVKEGFHVLAYFENKEKIDMLDKLIDSSLDKSIKDVKGKKLGIDLNQTITDEYDESKYEILYYLNQRIPYTFKEIVKIIKDLDGLVILAHIDRKGTGILDYIQDFDSYKVDGIEIYNKKNLKELEEKYPYIKKYKYLFNSDAHDIEMINEKINYMELDDLSFDSFRKYLHE